MPGAGRTPGKACRLPAFWVPLQACSGAAEAGPLSGPKGMQQRGLRPPRGVTAATAVLQVDEAREPPAPWPPRAPGHLEGAPHCSRRDPAGHGRHQLFQDGVHCLKACVWDLSLMPTDLRPNSWPHWPGLACTGSLCQPLSPPAPAWGGSAQGQGLRVLVASATWVPPCWSGGPVLRMWGCPQLF